MSKGPKESLSQRIGHHAAQSVGACAPSGWRVGDLSGDDDAGYDIQVQFVNEQEDEGEYQCMFHAQIKGSKQVKEDGSPKNLRGGGKYYSVKLEKRTLNYYIRNGGSVILLFSDLTTDEHPGRCESYYLWLDDELSLLRDGKDDLDHIDKDSFTFKVPSCNKLRDLDTKSYMDKHVDENIFGKNLVEKISSIKNIKSDTIDRFTNNLNSTSLDAIANLNKGGPWVENEKTIIAEKLRESINCIENRNFVKSTQLLDSIDIPECSQHEKAELMFQRAKILKYENKLSEALEMYRCSDEEYPNEERYEIAYLDCLILIKFADKKVVEGIIERCINKEGLVYRRYLVKAFCALGRYDEAKDIIAKDSVEETFICKIIIYLSEKKYKEGIEFIDEHEEFCEDKLNLIFYSELFKGICLINLGYPKLKECENILVVKEGMDLNLIRKSFISFKKVWGMSESVNYPEELVLILDLTFVGAFLFNGFNSVIEYVGKFYSLRKNDAHLMEVYLALAQQKGDDSIVDDLILNYEGDSINLRIKKIIHLHTRRELVKVVDETIEIIDELDGLNVFNADTVLGISYVCAKELMENDKAEVIYEVIKKKDECKSILAVCEFNIACKNNYLSINSEIEKLYSLFEDGDYYEQLLFQIFKNIDISNKDGAMRALNVADVQKKKYPFELEDSLKYCNALLVLEKWEEANGYSDEILLRYGECSELIYMKAFALDQLGQTPEALKVISDSLTKNNVKYNIELFVKICSRSGLVDKALEKLKEMLPIEKSNSEKFVILTTIFKLRFQNNPGDPLLIDVWRRSCEVSSIDNEIEQRTIISTFNLASQFIDRENIKSTDVELYNSRLEAYHLKYPDSKEIRIIQFDKNASGEENLKKIKQAIGADSEIHHDNNRLKESLENGALKRVPYYLKPKFISNVSNIVDLFEYTKVSHKKENKYRLDSYYENHDFDLIFNSKNIPLIDIVSVLYLHSLNLLDLFIESFNQVAIKKSDLVLLNDCASNSFLCFSHRIAADIFKTLSKYSYKIIQPGREDYKSEVDYSEHLNLIKDNDYLFCCEDVLMKEVTLSINSDVICFNSFNFVSYIYKNGNIDLDKYYEICEKVCGWNIVGISIELDVLIKACGNINDSMSVNQCIEEIDGQESFDNIFDSVWDFDYNPKLKLHNLCLLINHCLMNFNKYKLFENIIAAIWIKVNIKTQLDSKIEHFNRDEVLCYAYVEIALKLKESLYEEIGVCENQLRLRNVFFSVLKFFINDFDEAQEKRIWKIVSRVVYDDRDFNLAHGKILKSITSGTKQYDEVSRIFQEKSIERIKKR